MLLTTAADCIIIYIKYWKVLGQILINRYSRLLAYIKM